MLSSTLVPELFIESFLRVRKRERDRRLGGNRLDLQPQFREDDSCQTRQSEQWQL